MSSLYYLGIILLAGIVLGKLVSLLKLPNVTGYLIAGVLMGPSLLDLVSSNSAANLSILSDAALGFIAYNIGSQFELQNLKQLGKRVVIITIFEALGAVILLDLVLIFIFHVEIPFSIVLGSIGAATAPAATLMVVRQYKAKGPVVNTLLPVVAIDDAVGIILFGISMAIAKTLIGINGNMSLAQTLLSPVLEIIYALLVGLVFGLLLTLISKRAEGEDQLLSMTIACISVTIGISLKLNLSSPLSCMMLGATIANIAPRKERTLSIVDKITPPLFIAFFTLAGIELNLGILTKVGTIGIVYIITRALGKLLGSFLGARITKSPKTVQKYLGLTLIPQAGVAIGLAMVAEAALPEFGFSIRTIILSATVVYELIGPLLAKMALTKAGEIAPTPPPPKLVEKNL